MPAPTAVPEDAVRRTLDELEKWRRREADLEAELVRARRQVAYYAALAGDMKKEIQPAKIRHLFTAISR